MTSHGSRREFLRGITVGAVLWPGLASARIASSQAIGSGSNEAFWEDVRRRFSFREEAVPMNAANLCPSPRIVSKRVTDLAHDINIDCSSHNRRKFRGLLEQSREKVARQLSVTADEIALVRNTSEANNIINNGLPLKAGTEVVLWDQNHPTNNVSWEVRAIRFGCSVTKVSTPVNPTGIDEVIGAFENALTPRTRVLALTHTSNTTGVRLPVRELCEIAHRRSIHVHVDGAQTWGFSEINLRSLGCDSYTASAHKWFVGPKEVGLLYVGSEHIDSIWPGVIGANWGSGVQTRVAGARKFESLGQRNDAALAAIGTTADFHDKIGRGRIEARVLDLAAKLKEGFREAGYELVTPMTPELSAGVCIAAVKGEGLQRIVNGLYEEYGIAAASAGGLRLSPHLYNTREHIDRAIKGARALRHLV